MEYVLTYEKTGLLAFVGHLDFMRFLRRQINRAGLPAAYSQGFNPHMLLSVACPLPVGFCGLGEIFTVKLTDETPPEEIVSRLNANAPGGFTVLGARAAADGEKNPASLVCAVKTYIDFPEPLPLADIIPALLRKEALLTAAVKNGKTVTKNIKQGVVSLEAVGEKTAALVSAQNAQINAKPQCVARLIAEETGGVFEPAKICYTRAALFKHGENGRLKKI